MSDDKFTLDIDVNTKDANKKLKEVQKEADKTADKLSQENKIIIEGQNAVDQLNNVNKKLDELDKKLGEVKKSTSGLFDIGKIVIGFEAVKGLLNTFIKGYKYVSNTAHDLVSLSNTADSLRISANSLKTWEAGFKAMGFSAQEADNALGNLQDKITGQLLNPSLQVASAFSMMGISLRKTNGDLKTSQDLMLELAQAYKKLKPEYALALGQMVGQSGSLVMQLRKTSNVNEIKKLLGQNVVTDKQIDVSRKAVSKEAELGTQIDALRYKAFTPLIDAFNKLIPPVEQIANTLNTLTGYASTVGNVISGTSNAKASDVMSALIQSGKLQGMSQKDINTMLMVAQRESSMGTKTSNPNSSATGTFQWMPKTWKSLMGGSPMTIANEVTAYKKMYSEFLGVAKKNNINPTPEQYSMYHMLGGTDYMKAVNKMKSAHHSISMQEAFSASANSESLIRQNPNVLKQSFPYSGLENLIPMSTQSSNVQNTVNHSKVSNISSSTHIGTMNVNANNPEQLSKAIRNNTQYLDRTANMMGQLS